MKKVLVVGNWKAYLASAAETTKLAGALRRKARNWTGVEVVVAPSHPFLSVVAEALGSSPIEVAAQAVSPFVDEKRTGEVTAAMARSVGARFAIVGHSERRAMGEDNEHVALEVQNAIQAELKVILCVGEVERDAAGGHFAVIAEQLRANLRHVKAFGNKIIVAYEPVWAIGKTAAESMKPAELQETVIFIRKTLAELFPRTMALKVPILYGGSVEPENTAALLREGGVSGFLVGHASTDADSFTQILDECKK